MIKLGVMNWSHAFSYGPDNTIDFNKDELVQLIGKNGHGKSSIALILEEVLFNKNSKGIKKADILNRYSDSKKYTIELYFTKEADSYVIKTSRGATQTVSLSCNGIDISSHTSTGTYKLIEEILGFDHKTFTQIVYQSSAYSLEFLVATDTNRKKFLIDLLNLSIYTRAADLFKGIIKDVSLDSEKVNVRVKTLADWITKFSKESLVKKELLPVPNSPTDQLQVISVLQEQLKNIEETNKRIVKNNKYKQIFNSIELTIVEPPTTDITALKITEADLIKRIAAANKVVASNGNISDKCDKCGAPIDNQHKKNLVTDAARIVLLLEPQLALVITKIAVATNELTKYNNANNLQIEWEKYRSLIDNSLPEELLNEKNILDTLNTGLSEVKRINEEISKANKFNTEAVAHNTKIDVIISQMADMSAELIIENTKADAITTQLNTLSVLQKTFSTTGLVAYKIECLVKDLEQLTNDYLLDMSDGRFQISFKVNSSDKLNVIITDNGRDIDILALSNGERARVNVATLLAIRKLMQSLSNSRINLLMLDETVESLDVEGKEKLIEVLLKEEYLNTVLVSHSFTHPLVEKLHIIKENNISRMD